MAEGSQLIHEVWGARDQISVTDRSLIWNSDLIETLGIRQSHHSGGRHHGWRGDAAPNRAAPMRAKIIPARDDKNWMKHTLASIDARKVSIDYRPVHSFTMTNEMHYIEPKARVLRTAVASL